MSTPRSAVPDRTKTPRLPVAHEVAEHLQRTPRQLPTHYLYDRLGSTLFEAICHLPWYRIATVEQQLLATHARDIHAIAGPVGVVVELGPGSGEKLVTLLGPRQRAALQVRLIDVSVEALEQASRALGAVPGLDVQLARATYEDGLAQLAHAPSVDQTLVVFLGSNIGNFDSADADRLLRAMRTAVGPGSSVLIGADLVKPEAELLLAYDDPLGVTAAFNRNLLVRLNRELGADFDLGGFAHRAVWNAGASRVEMHLVSLRRQHVCLPSAALELTFEAGESIWTERSYKYTAGQLRDMLARAGFGVAAQWERDGFALTLATPSRPATTSDQPTHDH